MGQGNVLLLFLKMTWEMLCAIWYHLYNLRNVDNIHDGVLLFVKLQASTCKFTKSDNPTWMFSAFFKWHEYEIAQSITYFSPNKGTWVNILRFFFRFPPEEYSCIFHKTFQLFISSLKSETLIQIFSLQFVIFDKISRETYWGLHDNLFCCKKKKASSKFIRATFVMP